MILVCPSCDSKFNVPDNAIPPEGRKVRCAQCGHAWHATHRDKLKPRPAPARAAPAAPVPQPVYAAPAEEVDAGAAAQAAAIRRSVIEEETVPDDVGPDEDLFDEGAPAGEPVGDGEHEDSDDFGLGAAIKEQLGDDFLPDSDEDEDDDDILARRRGDLRREAERKSLARKRQVVLVGWALLIVLWLATLGAFVFMKDTVTNTFPGTNQLYEFFAGARDVERFRPAEGEPLTTPFTEREVYVSAGLIGDLTRIDTVDGERVVVIVGELENHSTVAASVPKVEISIKNSRGQTLDQWVYDPPGLVMRKQATLRFETTRPVPAGMASVEIRPLEGTKSTNEAPSRL